MPYKIFFIDNIKVTALGDLDKELGDELRDFKNKKIDFPIKIINKIKEYLYYNKFDIFIYIPSNKNNGVMNFFADYFDSELNIKKLDCIRIKREIKEQKFLESLKDRSENIKNAFEILESEKLKNKNVLLIDDVYASGATLKEVIRLLRSIPFSFNLESLVFCYRNYIFK